MDEIVTHAILHNHVRNILISVFKSQAERFTELFPQRYFHIYLIFAFL